MAYGFVEHRLDAGGDPGTWAGVAAVFYEFKWLGFVVVPTTFLLLLFPDGRLLTDRWRPIAICAVIGILGVLVTGSATTDPLTDTPGVQNPFATGSPVWSGLNILAILFLYVGIFGSAACVVVRFRRAGHVQRQQIKWLAASGAIVAVIGPLDAALSGVTGDAAFVATVAGITCLPAAVGIGILRHRLYDIDVVINRTLVYGSLTATLAGAYLGAVLLLQLALSPLTSSSSLAIAISTLAVAALFQPARRSIQAVVDRRFYRRKYDAARTLEASAPACATRSTSTRSPSSCGRSSPRRCSRRMSRCGCAHRGAADEPAARGDAGLGAGVARRRPAARRRRPARHGQDRRARSRGHRRPVGRRRLHGRRER